MDVVQIGSLAILQKWVFLFTGFAIAYILLRSWLRSSIGKGESSKFLHVVSNSLFVLFVGWKASLILFEPDLVIKSPLSLLYFTGGSKGLLVSSVMAVSFYVFSGRKLASWCLLFQALAIFVFSTSSVYHFLFMVFLDVDELYHLVSSLLGAILVYFLYMRDDRR